MIDLPETLAIQTYYLTKEFPNSKFLFLKDLENYKEKIFIYTGCQIINKNVFSKVNKKSFSIVEIWNQLINENKLYGFESLNDFIHITDIEIFNKLSKN